jgi:nitroreductase
VPVGPEAPVMEVLRTMRAMRRLKPDPVPRDLLGRLVETATWAPSGGNAQLYSYAVVTERAQVARLGVLWRDVQSKYLAAMERLDPGTFGAPARRRDVGGGPVSGGTLRRDPGGDRSVPRAATRSPRSPAGRRPNPGSRPRFPAPHGEPRAWRSWPARAAAIPRCRTCCS